MYCKCLICLLWLLTEERSRSAKLTPSCKELQWTWGAHLGDPSRPVVHTVNRVNSQLPVSDLTFLTLIWVDDEIDLDASGCVYFRVWIQSSYDCYSLVILRESLIYSHRWYDYTRDPYPAGLVKTNWVSQKIFRQIFRLLWDFDLACLSLVEGLDSKMTSSACRLVFSTGSSRLSRSCFLQTSSQSLTTRLNSTDASDSRPVSSRQVRSRLVSAILFSPKMSMFCQQLKDRPEKIGPLGKVVPLEL